MVPPVLESGELRRQAPFGLQSQLSQSSLSRRGGIRGNIHVTDPSYFVRD